jgi:hypothetical protein
LPVQDAHAAAFFIVKLYHKRLLRRDKMPLDRTLVAHQKL